MQPSALGTRQHRRGFWWRCKDIAHRTPVDALQALEQANGQQPAGDGLRRGDGQPCTCTPTTCVCPVHPAHPPHPSFGPQLLVAAAAGTRPQGMALQAGALLFVNIRTAAVYECITIAGRNSDRDGGGQLGAQKPRALVSCMLCTTHSASTSLVRRSSRQLGGVSPSDPLSNVRLTASPCRRARPGCG